MTLASVADDIPLLQGVRPGGILAHDGGRAVTEERYLRDVASLAASLPQREHVLNLCASRYHFAVAFGAALVRGQRTLMPPTLTPHVVAQVRSGYPGLYYIAEEAGGHAGLECHRYDTSRPVQAGPVPTFPRSQVAAILFTSGSTGDPAPSPKRWESLALGAVSLAQSLELAALPGLTLLGTVPAQHMYGLEATVCLALQGGVALHAARPFFPADVCAALETLPRPRALVTTPVHLRAILDGAAAFPPIDRMVSSTAPLAVELAAEAEKALAAPLFEMYGCTEAGYVATRRPTQSADWTLAPGLSLRTDDAGTWVRGGHVPGEVRLGDIIDRLEGRRFRLLGRTADMINIGGKRSSLAHLDHQLRSIEGVVDGAFVMPEDDGGRVARLAAYVVAPKLSRRALMAALRQRIDAAFLPRPLCLVDALPRNETGKLPRSALAALSAEQRAKGR